MSLQFRFTRFLTSRIFLAAFIAVSLYLFNAQTLSFTPVTQLRFSHWFAQAEPVLLDTSSLTPAPSIEIEVTSHVQEYPGRWKVALEPGEIQRDRSQEVHRILELAQEAQVFHFEQQGVAQSYVSFVVKSEGSSFKAFLPAATITQNVKLQTLLQLLRVYGEREESVAPVRQATAVSQIGIISN